MTIGADAGHARENKAAALPILIEIGAVVIFAAAMALLASVVGQYLSGLGLIVVGVILALIPAAIWLAVFYQQDRHEPEPKSYVLAVFALGAVLAAAVGEPLLRNFFGVQNWIYDS